MPYHHSIFIDATFVHHSESDDSQVSTTLRVMTGCIPVYVCVGLCAHVGTTVTGACVCTP